LNIKTCMELLEIIDRQNELIMKLVNENLEQENIIKELMEERTETDLSLYE